MAAARVDLNGALIRPVDDPYYNQQGWGSSQIQPWWTAYNVGNTTPIASSNTPPISGGSLIGNALKQGWTAMVSPRKGVSEATTEVTAPTDPALMQNPLEPTTSKPIETKTAPAVQPAVTAEPPVITATATEPPALPVVTQPAIAPIVAQPTAITGLPQSTLVPGTVSTMQATTTVPTVGVPNTGQQILGATPNGLVNPNTMIPPPDLGPIILALEQSIERLKKEIVEIKTQLTKQPTIVATLSCGCPAPSGKSASNCNCSTKTDASKKTEEAKPSTEIKK